MKHRTRYNPVRARVGWWLASAAFRLAGWAAVAATAAALWPLTLVMAAGYGAAWLSGWPPTRLGRAAAWSLPMTGVWLLATAISRSTWQAVALAPVRDWRQCWHLTVTGNPLAAFAVLAPLAVPAGLALAGIGWAWRRYAIAAGLAGITASAPIVFDARQWRWQARTAAARIAAPGAVPLLAARDRHKELARIDTAQASLFTELEQLGADDSPATRAYRARIRERHAQHHNDRMSYEQQLTALQATAPQASDPALLDELPQAAALFDQAPEHIKEQLCAAFDIQVLYRDDRQQATIWATITDTTPQAIADLLADPRTDHDTHKLEANPGRVDSKPYSHQKPS